MGFFAEQSDALLHDYLTSTTWYVDKPSENAKFYRFAAALVREKGQLDIREVHWLLKEAAREWGGEYDEQRDGKRVAVLCERLQILYDFFNAVQHEECSVESALVPFSPSTVANSAAPSQRTLLPPDLSPLVSQTKEQRKSSKSPRKNTSLQQNAPNTPASTAPMTRATWHEEKTQGDAEQESDLPSGTRMEQFWSEVIRLYYLLLERREQPQPPVIPGNKIEAIHAEMARWAEEVLKADEITGAEKRGLVGTIVDKVYPPINLEEGSTVTIKWLQ